MCMPHRGRDTLQHQRLAQQTVGTADRMPLVRISGQTQITQPVRPQPQSGQRGCRGVGWRTSLMRNTQQTDGNGDRKNHQNTQLMDGRTNHVRCLCYTNCLVSSDSLPLDQRGEAVRCQLKANT